MNKESKAERNVREFVEDANAKASPTMDKWAWQEAEEMVEAVFDGWMFDGPWTTEEYYRFRAEIEAAVIEAAPRIARCLNPDDT